MRVERILVWLPAIRRETRRVRPAGSRVEQARDPDLILVCPVSFNSVQAKGRRRMLDNEHLAKLPLILPVVDQGMSRASTSVTPSRDRVPERTPDGNTGLR